MLIDKIIQFENHFAELQAKVVEKPYGRIFYDQDNPLSYDSNHAYIKEDFDGDWNLAINEIIDFYREMAIIPRVYTFTRSKNNVGLFLEENGFLKQIEELSFYVQKNKKLIDRARTIDIRRLHLSDEQELSHFGQELSEWGYKSLMKAIGNKDFYLFGGYEADALVCIASLYKQGDISRINDVFTKSDKRGKGYGAQLINFITEFNDKTLHTVSYLYANNPIAINMYKKAGYVEMKEMVRGCYWVE
ncbi:GNAT family N-acetyltransferase [Paenibacillus sp. BSR1-1]|uniref:GNAT family N-acetyltransferase n=1 Tax=Paenibacillus sp. BSR1-1 TaxID=3020845 RepID=UPI0025B26A50|nr:GNAT family N-acetyltransferase [Paenibacillus sp. BSR1-1]MDN3019120.1 GNAT family N-acetyltransferase [Paenibacillus sp. BSR1-1]